MENTAVRFGANLREVRRAAELSQGELADRMDDVGVPLRLNLISRLEKGTRVPDVRELLALAFTLGVSPNRLLLTAEADDEEVELTPTVAVEARRAWAWAAGDEALPESSPDPSGRGFNAVNRPHDPKSELRERDLRDATERLEPLWAMCEQAVDDGVSPEVVSAFVDWWQHSRNWAKKSGDR